MRIQNMILPDDVCEDEALYIRGKKMYQPNQKVLTILKGEVISTDTYMNVFDLNQWNQYTVYEEIKFKIHIKGNAKVRIFYMEDGNDRGILIEETVVDTKNDLYGCKIPNEYSKGLIYWEVESIEETIIYDAYYEMNDENRNQVQMALNICTYKRNKQITRNLEKILASDFFNKESYLYGKLQIFVTDNGEDLEVELENEYLYIFKNANHGGGTGGFTRGLQEIKNVNQYENQSKDFSYVIFMDDDVVFQMESFYRVYAFLCYLKKEKQNLSIAGRMFRLDKRHVQYTAMEKWNRGEIVHIGGEVDYRERRNIDESSFLHGDYGGWWFCVYPVTYALNNVPFPFYLHCDDVEYGLRFSGECVAIKGVQVWHETYEYRQSPITTFYDVRNALIVNALYGLIKDKETFIQCWGNRVGYYHSENLVEYKYASIVGMAEFIKGESHVMVHSSMPRLHKYVMKQPIVRKIVTPILWRVIYYRLNKKYDEILAKYERKSERYGGN